MNFGSPLMYISLLAFLYEHSHTKRWRERRHHHPHRRVGDEIYVPSLVNFQLKGKSLAWFPVKLINDYPLSKRAKQRKCRYIEEPKCEGTRKPKRIYNAQEDMDDTNAGEGEGDSEDEDDYVDEDFDNELPTFDDATEVYTLYMTEETTDQGDSTPGDPATGGPCEDETETPVTEPTFPPSLNDEYADVVIPSHYTNVDPAIDPRNESIQGSSLTEHVPERSHDEQPTDGLLEFLLTGPNNGRPAETIDEITREKLLTQETLVEYDTTADFITPFTLARIRESSTPGVKTTGEETGHSSDAINFTSGMNDFTDPQSTQDTANKIFPDSTEHPFITVHKDIILNTRIIKPYRTKTPYMFTKNRPIDTHADDSNSDSDEGDNEGEDYLEKEREKERSSTHKYSTSLVHIETPPKPQRPLDLHFQTCAPGEDSLEIQIPTFLPQNTGAKKKETCKHQRRVTKRRTTAMKRKKMTMTTKETTRPTHPQRYIGKATSSSEQLPIQTAGRDAKVLVRIPPSLSELPVVVLKDPKSKTLSLSLVSGDQDRTPNRQEYSAYPMYQQLLPVPYSYRNAYYSPASPYFLYGPRLVYNNAGSYLNFLRRRNGYINNLRWVRGISYDDGEDEKNATKWDIFLNI